MGRLLAAAALLSGIVALGLWRVEVLPPGLFGHAALMMAAWVAIMPAGILVARYSKVTPRQRFPAQLDNPFWWNWHRGLQLGGVAISLAGLALVVGETGGGLRTLHGQMGLGLVLLSLAQVAGTLLRGTKGGPTDPAADPGRPETWRGDHFDMTARRRTFERVHKTLGWSMLAASGVTIVLGMRLIGAPEWLLFLLGASYLIVLFAAADRAREGRRVDTYAAIWGTLRSPMLDDAPPRGRGRRAGRGATRGEGPGPEQRGT